ncbi:conserved Plasmodium protein, unknown function [Plasmodium malariae]|uniref:Uncharacterized protein n=1 Tax=Plasmodium malariae TaxID=5858 RepID=A0A1C3L0J9_PLAMA|nr:conserved Plasmodium protein, unknown function [Plasmodium malariae]
MRKKKKMSDFLGTRITNLDVSEIRKEFSKKRKHFDEYDFYVFYKNLVASDKKRKGKRSKKSGDKEEEFKPCNYVSSIYKSKKVVKKSIYDYIDDEDNIYEDIVTNENFADDKNFTDNISFTFFNESISYTLLRNNNYIDGIPIGVDLKIKNNNKKESSSRSEEKNLSQHLTDLSSAATPRGKYDIPPRYIYKNKEEDIENKGSLPSVRYCNDKLSKTNENGQELRKKENTIGGNIKMVQKAQNARKEIGPKLPDIFEEIRKNIGNDNNDNNERNENEYINILSYKNHIILIKMKEQREFEKRIKELYVPKNNFEGAFFQNNANSIYQKKKKEVSSLCNDFSKNTGGHRNLEMGSISGKGSFFSADRGDKKMFSHVPDDSYSDSSVENVYASWQHKKLYDECTSAVEAGGGRGGSGVHSRSSSGDSSRRSMQITRAFPFVMCDPSFLHENEMHICYKLYHFFFYSKKKDRKNGGESYRNVEELKDLYIRYSKLIRINNEDVLSKNELINLYVPKKNWVQANNSEIGDENCKNEIYVLKNRINFNNDLKKKNRFCFFCKMKENKIRVKNIFSSKEREEFTELMNKFKIFYLDFYTDQIINEDLNTNFQIYNYEFSKCVYDKLNISNVYKGNANLEKDSTPILCDSFLNIPQFIFESIFSS